MTRRYAMPLRKTAKKSVGWSFTVLLTSASPLCAMGNPEALQGNPVWTVVWIVVLVIAIGLGYLRHLRLVREKTAELRRELLERQLAEKELLDSEQQLRRSLAEKESLLKEIHHRVKNNLQIVASLLYLQEEYVTDEKGVEILRESQNRVKSMALIHEQLYGTSDLANIDFGRYIQGLSANLFDVYGINPNRIRLNVRADDIALGIDTAVPCGLIINELVSNSLKHAFGPEAGGTVDVLVKRLGEGRMEIVVADDGIGIADLNLDIEKKTLGLRLVDTLIAQLGGRLDVQTTQGARFSITLNITGPIPKEH